MFDYSNFIGSGNPNYKTGCRCKSTKTPSYYNTWSNMKQRCLNPKNHKYKNYGGRGIKICEEWMNIVGFSQWAIENGWQEGLSLDRIDNNGNYEPSNCRWVSVSENSKKKSTTKISDKTAHEIRQRREENWDSLAEEYNVSPGTIYFIMKNITHKE